jgi:acetyl-CoA/propionyl-CoA carboxylase, biotin carboxylase, biotin carboxyl carrier protein
MSELEILWRDETELAVRVGDEARRYSYVRRGTELLLTDGRAYWTIRREGAPSPSAHSQQPSGGRQGGPPTSGRVLSQMPGKVLDIRVGEGDTVAQGDVLLVLEAMKMEHAITAPLAGVLKQLAVETGQRVMPGALLAEIDPA